jgi:hypothetical protein
MAHMATSGRGSTPVVMRVVCSAWYTTPGATTRRSVGRSRSSRSSSTSSRSNNHATMACLTGSRKAGSKLPLRATRRRRWSSRMPRGHLGPSMATSTLTPVMMSTASSSTSCTVAPGTSHLGASSRRCAGRWQQLHPCRERRPTTSGWRHRWGSTPLTVLRTWREPGSFHWSSPQPSPTSGCTTS